MCCPRPISIPSTVLDEALASGLRVVVDFHEFTEMAKDPESKKGRFLALWGQIAEHCKDRPDSVLFELLNEPNGILTPELWNHFLREAAVIRSSNPGRTTIVGPGFWNGIGHLGSLELPEEDRNLIVTVHYYSPMEFTHQGAPWSSHKDKTGVAWNGTKNPERQAVVADLDKAQSGDRNRTTASTWASSAAYDSAEMSSRVRYVSFVAREAEHRGWSWAYWQLDNDSCSMTPSTAGGPSRFAMRLIPR